MTPRARILPFLAAAAAACATPAPRAPARPTPAAVAEKAVTQAAGPRPPPAPRAEGLSPRAQRLFEEAVTAEDEQRKLKVPTDWAYLERKWRAVLDDAEVAEARFNLGVALERQGRTSDARAEYERARAEKPSLRQASVNLGVLLERDGDATGAAAVYVQVAKDFPEDSVSRERLAALYRNAGQLDEAWRLAREALIRDPGSLGAYKVLVRIALQRNDLDLAKLIAMRAQKLDPSDPELPFFTGQVLARQGDDSAAAAQFQKAISLRPGFTPPRHALLDAALKKQAWGAVAEQAQALLKEEPNIAALYLALGIAQRHLGKADEALASYAQAEKLAGAKLPEVHLARGVLYARVKSECEPALAELKEYQRAAGSALADGGQVVKLQRECELMLEENKRARQAAEQMKAESAKQGGGAKSPATQPAGGGETPTSSPNPTR